MILPNHSNNHISLDGMNSRYNADRVMPGKHLHHNRPDFQLQMKTGNARQNLIQQHLYRADCIEGPKSNCKNPMVFKYAHIHLHILAPLHQGDKTFKVIALEHYFSDAIAVQIGDPAHKMH